MAATITQAQIRQRVKRRLNEDNNTVAGDLASGTSTTATLTTDDAIDAFTGEAVALLSRTCYPLRGQFSLTIAAANLRDCRLVDLSPVTSGINPATPSGAVLWIPLKEGVYLGSTRVPFASQAAIARFDPDYINAAATAITDDSARYWYPLGEGGIGLYPRVSDATGTLTVHGLFVHPAPATSGVALPQIPDDLIPLVECYVCALIAAKNLDDPTLAGRGPMWLSAFEDGRKQLYSQIDPSLRTYFPPFIPLSLAAAGE